MVESPQATASKPFPDEPADLDFDWHPTPVERTGAGRILRWPIVLAAVAMAALALVGVQLLITVPESRAEERADVYAAALEEFDTALSALRAAATPSDPAALEAFRASTSVFAETAKAELPRVIPLLPVGPIEDLRPTRSLMIDVSDGADALIASLDAAARYREAAASILIVPLLPTEAPTELIEAADTAIQQMTRETIAAARSFDADPAFADYRARVEEAIDALPDWGERYLLALRRGDPDLTATLIAEIQARSALANAELEQAVAEVDTAAGAGLVALAELLQSAVESLGPQGSSSEAISLSKS